MIIIDRIIGDVAVCEGDEGVIEIPLFKLPNDVKAGSVIVLVDGKYSIDTELESERRERILNLQSDIWDD